MMIYLMKDYIMKTNTSMPSDSPSLTAQRSELEQKPGMNVGEESSREVMEVRETVTNRDGYVRRKHNVSVQTCKRCLPLIS